MVVKDKIINKFIISKPILHKDRVKLIIFSSKEVCLT